MIKKMSQYDVSTTLDRLESTLKEKGIAIVARVDHAAAAKKVDMELRPTQILFFGNPKLGTPLMQSNQMAGLDLPMKVLAWKDENGKTWLGYHSPQQIADNLHMTDAADAVNMLAGVMEKLTEHATK